MQIKSSKDYLKFKKILGNRILNEKKIESLISDIESGLNMLPYCPIVVYKKSDDFMIVDGQHRFEAAKRLGLVIFYIECEELKVKEIAKLNSRSDKWKNSDFLECYIQVGLKDYELLYDFINKYKIIYSASIDLLMYGNIARSNDGMEKFRQGNFKCEYLNLAEELVNLTLDVFGVYKFSNDRWLIGAVHELKKADKCDFLVLKSKIKSYPNIMDQQPSIKEYKYNIEKVYNHANVKRTPIF